MPTAAPPHRPAHHDEPGAQQEEGGRRRHIGSVRPHLKAVFAEVASELKGTRLNEVEQVDSSRWQDDGSRVGGKLHVDNRSAGSVSDQQPVAERSSNHVFEKISVERGGWLTRERRQGEVQELARRVRKNRRSETWRNYSRQGGAGRISEVIDVDEGDGWHSCPADAGDESHQGQSHERYGPELDAEGHGTTSRKESGRPSTHSSNRAAFSILRAQGSKQVKSLASRSGRRARKPSRKAVRQFWASAASRLELPPAGESHDVLGAAEGEALNGE